MSSQKGNDKRTRSQKHKNIKAFKNDLHDTSHTIKKINTLEFYGLCVRCRDIIDWKVKYKKYKPLTVPKKCVKCLEKKVKNAYYIVCQDCCSSLKVCSKCSKSCEELAFGESELEKIRKENMFQQELKQLTERQRRKFLRLLEKGLFTKENLTDDPELMNKCSFSDEEDDFENDEEQNEENLDEEEEEDDNDDDDDVDDEDEEFSDKLNVDNNSEDDEYETIDEDEDDSEEEIDQKSKLENKSKSKHVTLTNRKKNLNRKK